MREGNYSKTVDVIRKAATPFGFVASYDDITNYRRVWTRDSVITGIASLLINDEELIKAFKAGLVNLFNAQHPNGFMPSNVQPESLKVSYGGTVGRVDNVSWGIIGLCLYTLQTKDNSLAESYKENVVKGFSVMDAWEYNGKGLMYVPQSGDWADEYIQHGYILYDQLLRVWALELASTVFENNAWREQAGTIRNVIEYNYWNHTEPEDLYAPNLLHQLKEAPTTFWFMGFNPSRIYPFFDLQANALALLLNVGTTAQQKTVLYHIEELIQNENAILPSFSPAITEKDWEMKELKNNYAYSFRNHPHEFHNGGRWPVWNGWMSAALAFHGRHESASKLLSLIDAANALNDNQFNECLHGETMKPSGVPYCIWSASGAAIAHQFLKGERLPI